MISRVVTLSFDLDIETHVRGLLVAKTRNAAHCDYSLISNSAKILSNAIRRGGCP